MLDVVAGESNGPPRVPRPWIAIYLLETFWKVVLLTSCIFFFF